MATIPTIKQSQVSAGVTKCRAAAIKVKCAESVSENDILVSAGWDTDANIMTVVKADANLIARCRGPFYVADYAASSGDYTPVAIPWKIITGLNTSTGSVGDAVWLDKVTAGGYTLGAIPAAQDLGAGGSAAFTAADGGFLVKVGYIIRSHASTGAIMLEPGGARSIMVGHCTRGGTGATLTVSGIGAEYNGSPVTATSGAAQYVLHADMGVTATGDLTITASANTTATYTYMIHI